ncbi:hypothetical protein HUZ36_14035 [Pseudoalteromonas sp. McH1-7]|uniref:hypothetical protein n=1 Tax=Pseudoalteromonas sp. McH1-7 TaxID=2745574 RepID=UPI001590E944|nr:hypothetical protein [Pseudoalteromonas sp. McH1-7]NUZ11903.1 hypothetical protein [Pseudoalteromonas sp. McH1-7]
MSKYRFMIDTPHGRFKTINEYAYHGLVFKSRNNGARSEVIWMMSKEIAQKEAITLAKLGFLIQGIYPAVEYRTSI